MYNGRATIFLSCSEKFKDQVAIPIRDALQARGINGIIVSDEPLPRNTDWNPDEKVDGFLNLCDAFVVLATPDDELRDGRVQTRQNVVDEIRRARERPGLAARSIVYKVKGVTLHSNINPTHEPLDIESPTAIIPGLIRQLQEWGILGTPTPSRRSDASEQPSADVLRFMAGLGLGDHDDAELRVYHLSLTKDRLDRQRMIERLVDYIEQERTEEDNTSLLIASNLLEALGRIDPDLVPIKIAERLSESSDWQIRACAAHLLWDRAVTSPGEVPLGCIGKLARPSDEDWYVWSPALAAAKELLIRNSSAQIIFDVLAISQNADDRQMAAVGLIEVAKVDYRAVPVDVANQLAKDEESTVSKLGKELEALIAKRHKPSYSTSSALFGM